MPRRKLIRKITNPPHYRGFSPVGIANTDQVVVLDYEEFEAIRLCDFDLYDHLDASRIMNISRPTFARIYESARRKVAAAFVQGLPIVFEGGKVYYDSDWYTCSDCSCRFNHPDKDELVRICALCGSPNILPFNDENIEVETHRCKCPRCGHEQKVKRGLPCSHVLCEKCESRMRRER
jgi:uncharacterized protein